MGVPVATITSEGQVMDPTIALHSLEIRKHLDRIPEARLVLCDRGTLTSAVAASDAAAFEPGKRVRIDMRYEGGDDARVFEGLVVRHAVEIGAGGPELHVQLKDAAIALTRQRKSAVYSGQVDSDVIAKLIRDAKLDVGKVDATAVRHGELVQHYASDWDFVVSRADANGRVVIVDDGALSLRAMAADEPAAATYRYGLEAPGGPNEIFELELEVDAGGQWSTVSSRAWDPAGQVVAAPVAAEQLRVGAGDVDASAVARKLGGDALALMLPAALPAAELRPWASARLARSRLSMLRGRLVVAGRADLKPFDRVALTGVGARFDGALLISGVIHRFGRNSWRTELVLGLSPAWFARTPDIADAPAGGLLPPVTGLQIGVVAGFEADDSGEHRIKVSLPALLDDKAAVWARVARPDAGKGRGFVFWPELHDEVVVGFLAGDPRQAVVLGGLHGAVNALPKTAAGPSEANTKRAIVSKSGTAVVFDDDNDNGALTISTPGGKTIAIDDVADAITIADKHGNAITMTSEGITLKSAGTLTLDAAKDVLIKGKKVDIQ